MSETAIVGHNIDVIQTKGPRPAFAWSVVIAGALAAWAVAFIFISLGSGIGLTVTSPYASSGPSAGTMSIAGAIWLLFTETVAFATGGYLAARLRVRDHIPGPETKFRDGAHGFMAWVIGASLMALAVLYAGAFTAKTAAEVAGAAAGGAAATVAATAKDSDSATGYYIDRLFRANAPGGEQNALTSAQRAEATRILLTSLSNGSMNQADKDYLARMIAARTGLSQEEAAQRVTEVQNQATQMAKEATDTARKAGAYLSFWSFMALLFGAVAATLAGIVGGELRDEV